MNYILFGGFALVATYFLLNGKKSTTSNAASSFQNINVAEAKNLMAAGDVMVLDVRTPAEVSRGMIEGAININVTSPDFKQKVSDLDTTQSYIVYCRSGRRSVTACNVMSSMGFEKLYNLSGGYNAWK